MLVSAVIPNYNGLYLLKQNLPKLIEEMQGNEIIVVDDGSTDSSVKYLKQNYPQIKLIIKPFNDGFAATVNLGVLAAGCELVLLINNDVIPKKDFLKYLLPHFQDPKVFAVGCLDESIEKNQVIKRGRGIGKFVKGFLQHQRGEVNKSDTLWVNGGSGIFRKSIWKLLGGMEELYNPFYWEDIDLSYRAQKKGYKILFEPLSQVIHKHEEGIIKQNYSIQQINQIAYRNQLIFVWLNMTSCSYIAQHLLYLPYYLISSVLKGESNFIAGFFMALKLLPEILKKRFCTKLQYIRSDQQVLANFK